MKHSPSQQLMALRKVREDQKRGQVTGSKSEREFINDIIDTIIARIEAALEKGQR